MATTRVQITPIDGGVNDNYSLHSQSGVSRNRKFSGTGSDTDIVTSSARAYVSALNKLLTWNARRMEQMKDNDDDKKDTSRVGDAQSAGEMPVVQVHS